MYPPLPYCRLRGKENTIVRDYVLPDYTVIRRGYVRPPEETTGRPKDNEQVYNNSDCLRFPSENVFVKECSV